MSGGNKEIDRNDEIRRQSIGCGKMLVLFGVTLHGFIFLLVYYDPNNDFLDKDFLWTAEINKLMGISRFLPWNSGISLWYSRKKNKKVEFNIF